MLPEVEGNQDVRRVRRTSGTTDAGFGTEVPADSLLQMTALQNSEIDQHMLSPRQQNVSMMNEILQPQASSVDRPDSRVQSSRNSPEPSQTDLQGHYVGPSSGVCKENRAIYSLRACFIVLFFSDKMFHIALPPLALY